MAKERQACLPPASDFVVLGPDNIAAEACGWLMGTGSSAAQGQFAVEGAVESSLRSRVRNHVRPEAEFEASGRYHLEGS